MLLSAMSIPCCGARLCRALATFVFIFSDFLTPVSNVSTSLLLFRTQTVFHEDRLCGHSGKVRVPPVSCCLGILRGILDVDLSSAGWVGRLRGGGRAWIRKTITKERKKETQRKKRNIGNTNLVASVSFTTLFKHISHYLHSLTPNITGQTRSLVHESSRS
jgi:hypothetical protein